MERNPIDQSQLSVILVDDEKKASANLKNMLLEFVDPNLNILGIASDTREAEALVHSLRPTAVFLDIEMPHENAFHFLDRIKPFDFEVVFVTAYDEYAIRAFRLNAIDYILKPIGVHELKNAVSKLKERIKLKQAIGADSTSFTEVSNQVNNRVKQNRIILKDISNTEVVDFKDIYFIEAQSSYSRIVFFKQNQVREMTLSSPLSDYEELLPADIFFRIHRSYLINCAQVKRILSDDAVSVVMQSNQTLPVSRRRYALLLEFLKNNDYYNE